MTSYLPRAWEGVERATRSPWAQDAHNVAGAKAILVYFVLIFPKRGQMSHIWDGSEDGLLKQRPRYKSQLYLLPAEKVEVNFLMSLHLGVFPL